MRSLIGALLLAALTPACGGQGDTQKAETPQGEATAKVEKPAKPAADKIVRSFAGTPAPTAPFEAKGGKVETIASYAGKPVLVNLWATWCAPCLAEMPALDRLAAREAGKLTVLTISQDLEGWKAVDGFFKPGRFKTIVPHLDQPNALPIALKARGLPTTVLYDAKGRELWRVDGPLEWDQPEVAALLP